MDIGPIRLRVVLAVLLDRIEVDLALGDTPDPVAELHQFVSDHPLREGLHGLIMLAVGAAWFEVGQWNRMVDVAPTAEGGLEAG